MGGADFIPAASRVLDLSYTLGPDTIGWPTDPGFDFRYDQRGMTAAGYFYAAGHFSMPEHFGTHMDAPLHYDQDGRCAALMTAADLIGPAAVIDFPARGPAAPDAILTVADIEFYEKRCGRIADRAIVVARSGWGQFWPNRKRYLGTDQPADLAGLHFPGISIQAAAFLLEQRQVIALVIDTASLDTGSSRDFPVHRLWLGADRPGFENLANAAELPPIGATLVCAPMKIKGGTGSPTRIFALLP